MTASATDPAHLEAFLRDGLAAEHVIVEAIAPLGAGYSRLMSKVDAVVDGERRSFVTRGDPPPGTALIESDRDVEWAVLSALTAAGSAPIAPARCYDRDGAVFGRKTIISDFIESTPLVSTLRQARPEDLRDLSARLARAAADIHASDLATLTDTFAVPSDWDAYVDTRIELWRQMERDYAESDPFIRRLASWLDVHRPEPAPLTLLHGDFHAGNVLVQPNGEFLVVDWEFPRVGDPREDLGWFSLLAAMMPPDLIKAQPQTFLETYRAATGLDERIANPDTIAYFQMLAGAGMFGSTMQQASALVRGEVSNIALLYVTGAIVQGHEMWMYAPTAIERGRA